jgi:hypothetical protein
MTSVALQDLESFKLSASLPDYQTVGHFLFIDTANGDTVLGINALGNPCLQTHGTATHWWRRRIFRPAGVATGTRGGRSTVYGGVFYWGWWDAATELYQCSLEFDGVNGQLRAYQGCRWNGGSGALIGQTGLMAFVPGSEFFAEAGVTIAAGTGGAMSVKINGLPALTLSGVATQTSAVAGYHTVQDAWGGAQSGFGLVAIVQQSDLYWRDGTTFLGPGRCFGMVPASAGDLSQFTPTGGANYANLAHLPPVGDANSNASSTVGQTDLVHTNGPCAGISVGGVMVSRTSRADAAGTRSGQSLLKSSTTLSTGAITAEGTGYATYFDCWDNDPATSAPFTVTAVNLAQIGYTVEA